MSQEVVLRRPRRRLRAALLVPLLSIAILVLGWTVLWGVARQQAGAALDGWIASPRPSTAARWTCPDRTIDGYPFRIAVACRDVGFEGVVDGSPGRGPPRRPDGPRLALRAERRLPASWTGR